MLDKHIKKELGAMSKKLDRLITLNEDLISSFLILKGVSQQEIRKIIGVDMKRITHISKQIKATYKK